MSQRAIASVMRPSFTVGGVERGLEQQRDVRLADDLVVEQQVPQLPAALRIVDGVGEAQLLDEAALAPAGPAGVLVGADDVHLDFARRIAAQPRAVLHQDDPRAVPRRGDGRANAGESAARDQHVGSRAAPGACAARWTRTAQRPAPRGRNRAGRPRLRLGAVRQHDEGIAEKVAPVHELILCDGARAGGIARSHHREDGGACQPHPRGPDKSDLCTIPCHVRLRTRASELVLVAVNAWC